MVKALNAFILVIICSYLFIFVRICSYLFIFVVNSSAFELLDIVLFTRGGKLSLAVLCVFAFFAWSFVPPVVKRRLHSFSYGFDWSALLQVGGAPRKLGMFVGKERWVERRKKRKEAREERKKKYDKERKAEGNKTVYAA